MVSGNAKTIPKDFVYTCLDVIFSCYNFDILIEGTNSGVETYSYKYAMKNNIEHMFISPKWKEFGSEAKIVSINQMIEKCNEGIVIWDGRSKECKYIIDELKRKDKLLCVFSRNKKVLTRLECEILDFIQSNNSDKISINRIKKQFSKIPAQELLFLLELLESKGYLKRSTPNQLAITLRGKKMFFLNFNQIRKITKNFEYQNPIE